MKKVNFAHKPVLVGDKVILRPFEEKDYDVMFEILEEFELRKLTGSASSDEEANTPSDQEEKEKTLKWYSTRNEQSDRLDLAVVHKKNGQIIGEVVFNEYEEEAGNVNFRVLLSNSGCDKGLGTEAVTIFIKYGMEELQLHRISLEVYSFNPRAERVYQKVGFKLEGIKREEFLYNDEYIDAKMYGLLQSDYIEMNKM